MARKTQKRSKLRPALLLAIAGGVVAAVRRRGGDAKEIATDFAERAKDAAPEPVKQAVDTAADKVSGGGDPEDAPTQQTRRFSAPAEAGAQPPAEPGGAPSDDPQPTVARSVAPDLQTKAHDLPAGTVMPDTSADDPSVQEAEAAAAADAGAIGGGDDKADTP
jgi:hypothetical protein